MRNSEISIRFARLSDLEEMQKMFVETITTICKNDYSQDQIKVWTSGVDNKQRWDDIITKQLVLIAQHLDKVVGYITLDNRNYIDLLYVHKDYQRQGIAQQLLDEIEAEAKRLKQSVLTSDVSKTAKPFFKKNGFKTITLQTKIIKDVEITNYKMSKIL